MTRSSAKTIHDWTLKGVLNEISQITKTMPDRSFAFVLGAGASAQSGIPMAGELARGWLEELHDRECGDQTSFEDWVKSEGCGIDGLALDRVAEFYPQIYNRRFKDDRETGYTALENAMEGREPSLGYSVLAEILHLTEHKVVVTTNFDNLVVDALAMQARRPPLVIGHESLTNFIPQRQRRPLIAKIHRDLLLDPKNTAEELKALENAWSKALRRLFQHHTPIFIGYGGNDGTLMGLLKALDKNQISRRLIWCYLDGEKPSKTVDEVIAEHDGIRVAIPGFDEFMFELSERLLENFDVSAISQRIKKLGEDRALRYQKQVDDLNKKARAGTPTQKRTSQILTESARDETNWWTWQLRASLADSPDERDAIYRQGLEKLPNSFELNGNYALFLKNVRKDFDTAEVRYKKALEIESANADIIGNYAVFLNDIRKDFDAAETLYKRALEIEPNNGNNNSNYANFLTDVRKDFGAAEVRYKKALETEPDNANIIGNYANFLKNVRKDFDAAEVLYKKALEIEPDHGNNNANYSGFMLAKNTPESRACAYTLSIRVLEISNPDVTQAVAEALLHLCLCAELSEDAMTEPLARLKQALTTGFDRSSWDFTVIFDAVLPHIADERRAIWKALGDAILDADQVKELDRFDLWQSLTPVDPFMPIEGGA